MPKRPLVAKSVLQRGYEIYRKVQVRLMFGTKLSAAAVAAVAATTVAAAAVAATTVAAAAVAAAAVATTGWNHKHTSRYD
jgi:hypothetical protein